MAPAQYPTRKLGRNGPDVAAIGLGLMGVVLPTKIVTPGDDDPRFELLDKAWEIGHTFWDTANIYGDSELLIGKWFEKTGKRKDIFLATKFAGKFTADGFLIDISPDAARAAVAAALEKLKTDYIDLFYVHRLDDKTPIEHTIEALLPFIKSGVIKHLGISECSANTLRRAHAVHPIAAVQLEYSPMAIEIEDPNIGLLAMARELGVSVVAYSPLGRGFLSGAIRSQADMEENDFRKNFPRFFPENFQKNLDLVDKFVQVAAKPQYNGASSSQIALAWVLAQGDDIIPIPGTRKTGYLVDNAAAIHIKLDKEDLDALTKVVHEAELAGDRYPEDFTDSLFRESVPLTQ